MRLFPRWRRRPGLALSAGLMLLAGSANAGADDAKPPAAKGPDFDVVCTTLQSAAQRNGLPVAFLTRLIWQESRFDANAVSPAGAKGVAQFMPGTAAYLGLANPFDLRDAIDKSAEFLRDLDRQFGNLGLAAAAYNAGPRRVQDWIAGRGDLPSETQAYVRIVSGHAAEEWRSGGSASWRLWLVDSVPCPQLVKLLAANPEAIAVRRVSGERAATPPPRVWGLQLIGDSSEAAALSAFLAMQRRFKAVLGGQSPVVLRSKAGRGHYWYRVRVAANSLFGAERLCSSLRAAGGSCLVQRD